MQSGSIIIFKEKNIRWTANLHKRVSDIILYGKEEANRLRNGYVGPEHLLLGMIREGENKAIEVLESLYVDVKKIKYDLESVLRQESAPRRGIRREYHFQRQSDKNIEGQHTGGQAHAKPGRRRATHIASNYERRQEQSFRKSWKNTT